jgi:hypothetical protein
MFGLFKSEPCRDARLGELRRQGRYWRGTLKLPPWGTFRLVLAGTRQAPDLLCLELAKELPNRFLALRPKIQDGMFEHYAPDKETIDAHQEAGGLFPSVWSPGVVWQYSTPAHVLIESREGVPILEIAFRVAWDEEHTIRARFRDWQFIELNGSVRVQ